MLEFEWSRNLSLDGKYIREKVFIEEQGFSVEFDDIDNYAYHLILKSDNIAVGYARIYQDSDDKELYHIGRIVLLKEYRGKQYGSMIVKEAENKIIQLNGTKSTLSAQCRAVGFYEKSGYHVCGEEYMDEFCPHIKMIKNLQEG